MERIDVGVQLSRVRFMVFSSVFLTLVLTFNCIYLLRQEQQDIRVIIESISEYLLERPVYDEESDNSLLNQLREIKNYLEELKAHNRELEETLSLRQQNYVLAVNLQGADLPVLSPSGFSGDMLERAWRELGADKMSGLGHSFIQAEIESGINALVGASIAAHESSFGRSRIAVDKNNLFGFGAYCSSPYQFAVSFENKESGISYVSEYIKKHYFAGEGQFYQGDTLRSMGLNYAADTEWPEKVARMMALIAGAAVEDGEIEKWERLLK